MLKIAILTIGDELLIGQTINTNASFIGSECVKKGASIVLSSTIPDNLEVIKSEIVRLSNLSNIVIISGGLGPTKDDVTKTALCQLFHTNLIEHSPTMEKIATLYKRRNRPINETAKMMAMVPENCNKLNNSVGVAPGLMFDKDSKYFFSVPGVPAEMKILMKEHILPFIEEQIISRNEDVVVYRTIVTAGLPESVLSEELGNESNFMLGGSLAFLPSYHGVKLRIGIIEESFDSAKLKLDSIQKYIEEKVGDYIIGMGEQDLISVVFEKLIQSNKTVSVAESCTGGLLGASLTELPGSSSFFLGGMLTYSNEVKAHNLNVDELKLEQYGAVSEEVAFEMANNVRLQFGSDYGIAITGIAGPDGGSEDKPVGTVCFGLSTPNKTYTQKVIFGNNRKLNREMSVTFALKMLLLQLNK